MTTLPPEPAPASPDDIHRARSIAESFGIDAARYDRARPHYPEALVRRIVAAGPGTEVLNVGCGTGIEARQFQAAGCTVLGVEPDARMAEFARRGGCAVEVAKFEDWDPAGRAFDAVVAGTAWHWVDLAAGAAKAALVLRPGGLLAPFWHVFEFPPEVARAFAEVYRRLVPDLPFPLQPDRQGMSVYQQLLTAAADAIRETGAFAEPEQWEYAWNRTYDREQLLDLLPTHGVLTRLPPDQLARVLDAIGGVVDSVGGSVTMSYTAVAVIARRAGEP
jgi:SAM-dependent methyltransferase